MTFVRGRTELHGTDRTGGGFRETRVPQGGGGGRTGNLATGVFSSTPSVPQTNLRQRNLTETRPQDRPLDLSGREVRQRPSHAGGGDVLVGPGGVIHPQQHSNYGVSARRRQDRHLDQNGREVRRNWSFGNPFRVFSYNYWYPRQPASVEFRINIEGDQHIGGDYRRSRRSRTAAKVMFVVAAIFMYVGASANAPGLFFTGVCLGISSLLSLLLARRDRQPPAYQQPYIDPVAQQRRDAPPPVNPYDDPADQQREMAEDVPPPPSAPAYAYGDPTAPPENPEGDGLYPVI